MTNPVTVGLNIRKAANGRSEKLGLLPRGAVVEIGERSADGKWGKIVAVSGGAIAPVQQGQPVDPAASTGWVYLGELDPEPPEPEAFDTLVAPDKPVPIKSGDIVGHLGEYQDVEDARPVASRGVRPLLHFEIFSSDDVRAFIGKCRTYAKTLPVGPDFHLVIEPGAKLVQPSAPTTSIEAGAMVAPQGDANKAGAYVSVKRVSKHVATRSSLGAYTTATKTYANGAVFTGWYVGATDDLRTQSESEATKKGYARREVLAPTGNAVWAARADLPAPGAPAAAAIPAWTDYPLKPANGKDEVGLTRVVSRGELDAVAPIDRAVDPDGKRWWRLHALSTSTDPEKWTIQGWVCEKDHPKVTWQSPWAWPGFDFMEEDQLKNVDMLSTHLLRSGAAETGEAADFKMRADKVDQSALSTKLHEYIDVNHDNILDAQELQQAYRQPLLAQPLTRIIARYESEWGGEMAKWNELDPLMLDDRADWETEKQRIDKLRWWPKAAEKVKEFKADPTVYHIHPIGLIHNFYGAKKAAGCCEITVELIEKVFHKSGTWFNGKGGGKAFEDSFKTNYPDVYQFDKARFIEMLNAALERWEITECYQKAHFLAQSYHECARFETTIEFASGNGYNPGVHKDAEKNGNTEPGDGPKYRGRGLIQLTWKNNYRAYGAAVSKDFVTNYEDIARNMYNSIDASCWYWRKHGTIQKKHDAKGDINKLIAAEKDNVALITLAVNGGSNGLPERIQHFNAIKAEWKLT